LQIKPYATDSGAAFLEQIRKLKLR